MKMPCTMTTDSTPPQLNLGMSGASLTVSQRYWAQCSRINITGG